MTVQERNVQIGCAWLTCSSNLKKINNAELHLSEYLDDKRHSISFLLQKQGGACKDFAAKPLKQKFKKQTTEIPLKIII